MSIFDKNRRIKDRLYISPIVPQGVMRDGSLFIIFYNEIIVISKLDCTHMKFYHNEAKAFRSRWDGHHYTRTSEVDINNINVDKYLDTILSLVDEQIHIFKDVFTDAEYRKLIA